MPDIALKALCDQVQEAYQQKTVLNIQGAGSKSFLGPAVEGELLDLSGYRGIVQYDPTELVITARAGTPISEIEQALNEHHQALAFEPPKINGAGTVGGMVACGLAGPRRPWSGGVRDHTLGLGLINGKGQHLRFGGQVMKNVAGYDVSRLMVGSMGCLSVLTDISLKVLPQSESQQFFRFEASVSELFSLVQTAQKKMTPISGVSHDGANAHIRIEGREERLTQFADKYDLHFDAEIQASLAIHWEDLCHHQHDFFGGRADVWQLSLPKWSDLSDLAQPFLMDWAGARYWVKASNAEQLELLKERARKLGGYLSAYDSSGRSVAQYPSMPVALLKLHQNLKNAYDPAGILNPGRLLSGGL